MPLMKKFKHDAYTTLFGFGWYYGWYFVGIGYLWLSGGLNDLLNAGNGASGAEGVEALLGGVLGNDFKYFGDFINYNWSLIKNVKFEFEKNKHLFKLDTRKIIAKFIQ